MEVSGLLFDMDDVLYDDTLWHRWLFQLLSRMGLRVQFRSFFRVWQQEYLDEVNRGRRDYWEALGSFLVSSGLSSCQAEEVLVASHARRDRILKGVRPLPGVARTTAKLNGIGVPLAVLSNSALSAAQIQKFLSQLGFSGRFETVVSSNDLGVTKPNQASYQAALAAMHMDAGEVAFVGHDARELQGAKDAGMQTIGVNRDPNASADLNIDHFDQLLSLIRYRSMHSLAG